MVVGVCFRKENDILGGEEGCTHGKILKFLKIKECALRRNSPWECGITITFGMAQGSSFVLRRLKFSNSIMVTLGYGSIVSVLT